jgi:multiple sugar transport system substrate-binding protein
MRASSWSRREFLRMGATVAGMTFLAACAPTTETPDTGEVAQGAEEPQAAPETKVKVEYWDVSSPESLDGQVKEAMINRFREKHPELEVESVYKPTTEGTQMSEALLTAIAGGTPPDAAYFDRFIVAAWAAEDSLTDLTDLCANAGITKDDYYDFAWTEVTGWKGKVWALPFDTDTRALYVNKQHLLDAGLDPDNIPQDLDTFDQWAEQLFEYDGPRLVRAGFIPWYAQGGCPYVWGWTFGAEYWSPEDPNNIVVNSEQAVASMEWRRAYAEKYGAEAFESFSSAFGTETLHPFYVDQMSMMYNGDWMLAQIEKYAPDLEFTVVPMPYPAGGRTATMAGGWSVVIPRGAKHVAEGFEFISYFAGPEEMDYFCRETAHIPTLKEAAAQPFYHEDPMHKVFMDLLPIANTRPPVPIGQFLWTALGEARDLVIHGTKTPKQALDDVQANAIKEMERFRE